MQPVKITIQGDYIDCQIYRGRLYLWTFNGALKVYNWNELVHSLIKRDTDKIAMTFCFLDGNYLYKSSLIELFRDSDFRKLLLEKFQSVSRSNFTITTHELEQFLFGEQQTPTGIIPTDTEIYSNKLYFIHESGLFSSSAHRTKSDKYPVSSRPVKLWDCRLLSIKANKYPQLALSAGSDGLFELNMSRNVASNLKKIETRQPIYNVSDKHSSYSNYTFLSIYNTSVINNSFLALFKWNIHKNKHNEDVPIRDFEKTISDKIIFKSENKAKYISWGIEDKIYKATESGFEIIKFNNYADKEKGEENFTRLQSINLHAWKGKVINGGTAYFGTIVECENALVVMLSNGHPITIEGPIIRWRVYPRSMNYENHLHVILNDRIEIFSFNQDYFLDQENKQLGIEFRPEKHRRNSRVSYFEYDDDDSLSPLPF